MGWVFEEFREKALGGKLKMVDMRDRKEYEEWHFPNTIWMNFKEIEANHKSLNANPEDEIIVLCDYGFRSLVYAQKLMNLGYKNVYSLKGGIKSHKHNIMELSESLLQPKIIAEI